MSEIKIRALTVADRDWLSDLIKKLVAQLGANEILRYMVSDNDSESTDKPEEQPKEENKQYALLVVEIIKMMIDVIGDDVRKWFASLINVSVEEFKKLPFDTELIIIEQLIALEESNRFFSRALALSSKIKVFVNGLKGKSNQ
jgi:hypothetical protein